MTLTKTASVSACQVADTKPTRLTLQAGTTRTTPSCGARRGLTIPTTFWRGTEVRSVSTTASNAERGIDEIPTVHMGVAACQMEKKGIATEKGALNRSIQKDKPPYPGNPGADWEAQRMDCRPVQSAGNRHGAAAAISQPCKSVDEVFERSERKEPEVFTELATTARRPMN